MFNTSADADAFSRALNERDLGGGVTPTDVVAVQRRSSSEGRNFRPNMRYDRLMQETSEQKDQGQLGSAWKRPVWKKPDHAAIAKLMEALMQGDEAEQRETFEALKRGLDKHRPEGYTLFS